MTEIAATFRRPFVEQVAAWRLRLGNLVPTAKHDDLWQAQHERDFVVAGATKADLLADLAAAVDKSISDGETFETFKKDFRAIVKRHGWHGWTGEGTKRGEEWRMRTIYRTNMRTSYMAGRYAQLVDGNYKFWIYRHSGARHPRLDHLSWDGIALPPDHPFWARHYPPNGWGCGCEVEGANTEKGIKRMGGDPDKRLPDGWDGIDPRTGAPPGIGKGWAYSPGAGVAQDILALDQKLLDLPAEIGAALGQMLSKPASKARQTAFEGFFQQSITSQPTGAHMVIGALKPGWVNAAKAAGVRPTSAEIVMRDRDILHTFRDVKRNQLDQAWFRGLPSRINKPSAVILDPTVQGQPTLILIFDGPTAKSKIVVRLDYRIKGVGTRNIVRTGRLVGRDDLKAALSNGGKLIEGSL